MKKCNSKGITLIALVITIIVLLILAAVSIATLTGENGILTRAENSKNKNKDESNIEIIKMAMSVVDIVSYTSDDDEEDIFEKELQKTDSNAMVDYSSNPDEIVVYYNDSTYIIDRYTNEIETWKQIDFDSIKFIELAGDYGISEGGLLYNISENKCLNNEEGQALYGTALKQISIGWTFCVVLDENGKVWTWGMENDSGELGNGTTSVNTDPLCISDIEGNTLKSVTISEISANRNSTVAVDSNGRVWSWGNNSNGQLGDGTTNNVNMPMCISDLNGNSLKNVTIAKVSMGYRHAMALDSNGKIWTWGDEKNGVLGNGSNSNGTIQAPICISDITGNSANGVVMKDISAGTYSSACLDINGNVWTWGLYYSAVFVSNADDRINNIPENQNNVSNNLVIKEIAANDQDILFLIDTKNRLNTMLITNMSYCGGVFGVNNQWYDIDMNRKISTWNMENVTLISDYYMIMDNRLYEMHLELMQ